MTSYILPFNDTCRSSFLFLPFAKLTKEVVYSLSLMLPVKVRGREFTSLIDLFVFLIYY